MNREASENVIPIFSKLIPSSSRKYGNSRSYTPMDRPKSAAAIEITAKFLVPIRILDREEPPFKPVIITYKHLGPGHALENREERWIE